MISLNREKRGHFNRLRAASHFEADLAFLKELDPKNELISNPSGKGDKYTDDILSVLLSLTTDCDIVAFRRTYVRNVLLKDQAALLATRFAEYLKIHADLFPVAKSEDVVLLVNSISEDLIIQVCAEIDSIVGANTEDIELKAIDNEHYSVCLTEDAAKSRKDAAEKAQAEADRIAQENADNAAKAQAEADRIAQENADNAAKAQAEADRIVQEKALLEDREQKLKDKEAELAKKEDELSDKESELEEKEDELSDKESELEDKAVAEKKSVSKKKNTQK